LKTGFATAAGNRLPLAQIEELPDKRVRIGALARNSDVAEHELIKTRLLA
jgi:xanthine dehydrogenase YagS FAD-binding subunit